MSVVGVSVVMPIYNEAKAIETTISSVLSQELGVHPIEILAVDGLSTDGTTEKLLALAESDPRIRVIHNSSRTTPFALNLGIEKATYDFVAVLGAHAVYSADYLKVCLEIVSAQSDVAGCSGRVIAVPGGNSLGARLAHWVMTSRIGSSGKSFRTQPEGPSDSIPYPVFRASVLKSLGGYNTRLTRNQDNDMNRRITDAGFILQCSWATSCTYKSPRSFGQLLRYAWKNGRWVSVSLRENPKAMRLRHFAPAIFAIGAGGSIVLALLVGRLSAPTRLAIGLFPLLLHLGVGLSEAVRDAIRSRDGSILLAPATALGFHLSYGIGTLTGLASPPG
jgi:glycosyltransferase involved in cell wall biosynthesis